PARRFLWATRTQLAERVQRSIDLRLTRAVRASDSFPSRLFRALLFAEAPTLIDHASASTVEQTVRTHRQARHRGRMWNCPSVMLHYLRFACGRGRPSRRFEGSK